LGKRTTGNKSQLEVNIIGVLSSMNKGRANILQVAGACEKDCGCDAHVTLVPRACETAHALKESPEQHSSASSFVLVMAPSTSFLRILNTGHINTLEE